MIAVRQSHKNSYAMDIGKIIVLLIVYVTISFMSICQGNTELQYDDSFRT